MLDFPGMSVLREYAMPHISHVARIFLVLISVIFPHKLAFSTAVVIILIFGNNLHYSRPLELLQNWLKSVE